MHRQKCFTFSECSCSTSSIANAITADTDIGHSYDIPVSLLAAVQKQASAAPSSKSSPKIVSNTMRPSPTVLSLCRTTLPIVNTGSSHRIFLGPLLLRLRAGDPMLWLSRDQRIVHLLPPLHHSADEQRVRDAQQDDHLTTGG